VLAYVAIGVLLLLALLLAARGIAAADPRALTRGVKIGAGISAAALVLVLLATRFWPVVPILVAMALPFLLRNRVVSVFGGAAPGGPGSSRRSSVATRHLRMRLDHETGAISGEIVEGEKAGRSLDSLALAELGVLLDEFHAIDKQSAALLEAYLERRFGSAWREGLAGSAAGGAGAEGATEPPAPAAAMSRREALDILGLAEDAGPDQVKDAYHRLMLKLHPDTGGSAFLAAKLNAAKALLLGE
jgi:hypothetical protein